YAKDRQQFGQPIGGFQAVKHRCADMAVRADLASSQVRWAALSIAGSLPDAGAHAAAAAIVASNAAITNAQTNIQNHGGIGFTWEHTAHRFVTRARMWGALLGGVRAHQAALLAAPTPN
ncbi:MAG TPA: acyl-CoA dehydrogenase family protein, partial [Microthrixaceae bacterium]|nr:acyl-CoA dehydrogenase family protein [Microthrixaceae bacterium]